MKTTLKTLIALLAVAAGSLSAAAQDTVYGKALPSAYYSSFWPDTTFFDTHCVYFSLGDGGRYGYIQYADSDLTIYGMAAALGTPVDFAPLSQSFDQEAYYILDTSRSALFDEHILLWEMYGDSIEQIADLRIPVSQPPDYYWDLMLTSATDREFRPLPMYERYFPEPITVQDSFIIGKSSSNGKLLDKPQGHYSYYNWNVDLARYIAADKDGNFIRYPKNGIAYTTSISIDCVQVGDTIINDTVEYISGWVKENKPPHYAGYVILFPIITPNPDTTHAGIGRMTPVERNTVVSPNPATETVRVASGFGLQAVEVYDAAGRRVYSAAAMGMQTHIDVGSWPRGTYTVHVKTPVGTAVKKLLVQ